MKVTRVLLCHIYKAALTYHVISTEEENSMFRHNRIFRQINNHLTE